MVFTPLKFQDNSSCIFVDIQEKVRSRKCPITYWQIVYNGSCICKRGSYDMMVYYRKWIHFLNLDKFFTSSPMRIFWLFFQPPFRINRVLVSEFVSWKIFLSHEIPKKSRLSLIFQNSLFLFIWCCYRKHVVSSWRH